MSEDIIIAVNSFDQIPFPDLASDHTLVLVDLDDTTFIETLAVLRNANFDARKELVESVRSIAGSERVTFLYDNLEYQLVEKCLPEKLKTHCLNSLGFTARRTGKASSDQTRTVEDATLSVLSSVGVQFSSNIIKDIEFGGMHSGNPDYKDLTVDTRFRPFEQPSGVMVKGGVVFCNNLDKGFVLESIFSHCGAQFNKLVLIDNEMKNHRAMMEAVAKLEGVVYVGYLYEGAKLLDNTLNPSMVKLQKASLLSDSPRLITDEEARTMI